MKNSEEFAPKVPSGLKGQPLFSTVLSIDCGQVVAAQVILGYILVTSFYEKES